ncbi:MAG: hypothetical protein KF696_11695 [Planctomycetes bacterium]|nr:hypothetical protein [Planctomycetota bacterium]MCW8136952.1 hypothetical protein [Planctomycetota bacterium]
MAVTRWFGLVVLLLAVVGLSGCGIVRHALHHHHHPKRHKHGHVTIVIEKYHHHQPDHQHDPCED